MYEKVCSHCKTRLSQFYKTGYLGCPQCYVAFEYEINQTLKKIQGKTYHVGDKPTVSEQDKELFKRYKLLLSEKERAGMEGRFRDMADISIEINMLQEELKRRGLM